MGVDTNSYMAKFIDKAIYLKNNLTKDAIIRTLKFCFTVNKDVARQLLAIAELFTLSLRELIQIDNDIEVLFTMNDGLYNNKDGLVIAFFMHALKRKEFDRFKEIVDKKNFQTIQSEIDLLNEALIEPDSNKLRKSKSEILINDDNYKLYYTIDDLALVLKLLKFIADMNYDEIIKIIINRSKRNYYIETTHTIDTYLRRLCL